MKNGDKERKIQQIASQIRELSQELERLLTLDNGDINSPLNHSNRFHTNERSNDGTGINHIPRDLPNDFMIGYTVEILNRYKGLKGARGTVTKVTEEFIYFNIERNGIKTCRHRKNLKRV